VHLVSRAATGGFEEGVDLVRSVVPTDGIYVNPIAEGLEFAVSAVIERLVGRALPAAGGFADRQLTVAPQLPLVRKSVRGLNDRIKGMGTDCPYGVP
jgi:hypothetical protein